MMPKGEIKAKDRWLKMFCVQHELWLTTTQARWPWLSTWRRAPRSDGWTCRATRCGWAVSWPSAWPWGSTSLWPRWTWTARPNTNRWVPACEGRTLRLERPHKPEMTDTPLVSLSSPSYFDQLCCWRQGSVSATSFPSFSLVEYLRNKTGTLPISYYDCWSRG